MPSARLPPEPGSAQVWRPRDAALRPQAIAVVAQRAFNVVKTPSAPAHQASEDAHPTQLAHAPPCARDPSRARLRAPSDADAGPRPHGQYDATVSTRSARPRPGMAGASRGRHGPRSGPFRGLQRRSGRLCVSHRRRRPGSGGSRPVVRSVPRGPCEPRRVAPHGDLCLDRYPGARRRWGRGSGAVS